MTAEYLTFHPEVKKALSKGAPVVALESTIIAHGMPYPQNIETARRVEDIVRSEGAVPATIAILDGKIVVGLTEQELERVAQGADFLKVSRRDIPLVIAKKRNGATTVAATMFIAALTGIRVLVTGGIGGVHRGAAETLDVSADLMELAASNVAVVCAGAKAILDIGLTLEYLETHGVPVVGYRTEAFPAFYTRDSGFGVDYSVLSLEELARALRAKWALGLTGGMVVANPIPEEHELEPEMISRAISEALAEAKAKQIRGKETTPFLLSRIETITGGKSLKANIELVCHNAQVGAKLARELATL
ncbi:MAG: pseudouridine-5'-phosphate glycosidase [Calditrichaeota bacterium]|nr:MAG: pseudouridine-5'-phosphate glycosidase [Calditrichota bacterium]